MRRITANRVYDVKNASSRVYHCVLDSRSGACGNTVYVTRTFVLSVFSFVTDKNHHNTHNNGKRCKHAAVKLILLSISVVFVAAVLFAFTEKHVTYFKNFKERLFSDHWKWPTKFFIYFWTGLPTFDCLSVQFCLLSCIIYRN